VVRHRSTAPGEHCEAARYFYPNAPTDVRPGTAKLRPTRGAADIKAMSAADALAVVQDELGERGWTTADLVASCDGSPSRATIYAFLASQPVSRRCQALILRAVGRSIDAAPDTSEGAGADILRPAA
jgi:hypothetical protein